MQEIDPAVSGRSLTFRFVCSILAVEKMSVPSLPYKMKSSGVAYVIFTNNQNTYNTPFSFIFLFIFPPFLLKSPQFFRVMLEFRLVLFVFLKI